MVRYLAKVSPMPTMGVLLKPQVLCRKAFSPFGHFLSRLI
jgi:hypothetical protein